MKPNSVPRLVTTLSTIMRAGVSVGFVILLASCGDPATTETPATETPAVASTTTAPRYSREALEALHRCLDQLDGIRIMAELEAAYGVTERIDTALVECEEAQLQIDVDNDRTLVGPIDDLTDALRWASLKISLDAFDGVMDDHSADLDEMQVECENFTASAREAMG